MHTITPEGVVFHSGTEEEARETRRILYARQAFALKYMAKKGWGDDFGKLSFLQLMEIRDQPGWENPKVEEESLSLVLILRSLGLSLTTFSLTFRKAQWAAALKYMEEMGWGDDPRELTFGQFIKVCLQPRVINPPPYSKKAVRLFFKESFLDSGCKVWSLAKNKIRKLMCSGVCPQ